jgi:hypothetical protein
VLTDDINEHSHLTFFAWETIGENGGLLGVGKKPEVKRNGYRCQDGQNVHIV